MSRICSHKLDGRAIRRFDGRTAVLHTRGARVVALEMSLRQRVLSSIAHPNIAYLLLSLGMLGLTIELWSPGAILPGVVGGVSLLLAFFALQVLPVNYAGLLLILLGLLLLALEIKVTSYGLLTGGGLVSLLFGSMMLIDSPAPELRVSLRLVIAVVLGFSAIGITLARLGLAAQRQPAVTGETGMIDQPGRALTAIEPGGLGRVFIHGESWQATARRSDCGRDARASGQRQWLDPDRPQGIEVPMSDLSPALIVVFVLGAYLVSSIKILAEYERGVIFRLGKLLSQPKGPGVILVFAPIDQHRAGQPADGGPRRAGPGRHHQRQRLGQGERGALFPRDGSAPGDCGSRELHVRDVAAGPDHAAERVGTRSSSTTCCRSGNVSTSTCSRSWISAPIRGASRCRPSR